MKIFLHRGTGKPLIRLLFGAVGSLYLFSLPQKVMDQVRLGFAAGVGFAALAMSRRRDAFYIFGLCPCYQRDWSLA